MKSFLLKCIRTGTVSFKISVNNQQANSDVKSCISGSKVTELILLVLNAMFCNISVT
jgi:hypothetical protein